MVWWLTYLLGKLKVTVWVPARDTNPLLGCIRKGIWFKTAKSNMRCYLTLYVKGAALQQHKIIKQISLWKYVYCTSVKFTPSFTFSRSVQWARLELLAADFGPWALCLTPKVYKVPYVWRSSKRVFLSKRVSLFFGVYQSSVSLI